MTRPSSQPGEFRPSRSVADHAAPAPNPAPAVTARSGRGHRLYVSTWAVLGLASAGYLGIMSLNGGGAMQRSLAQLRDDVRDIKSTVAEIDARERAATQRIATIEDRIGAIAASAAGLGGGQSQQAVSVAPPSYPGIAVVATKSAPPPPPAAAPAEPIPVPSLTANEPQRPTKIIAQVPQPDEQPKVTAAVQPKVIRVQPQAQPKANDAYSGQATVSGAWPIDTGSTTPAARPATPAAPIGPRALQIGTGPSLDAVKLNWSVLSQAHSPVLGGLEPRIVPSGDGRAFRLLAGPFASDADAQKACAQLKARGVSCRSTEYSGAPL